MFTATTNPAEATADGIAAALRAGAAVGDLEFVQFHPTVLWLGQDAKGRQPLISEAVRGEGPAGRRGRCPVMTAVHPMAELAPRDVVAKAIVRRMAATGSDHVFLDARHLGAAFLHDRFPTIGEVLAEHGVDPATDLVPVAPAQHYHSGGVTVDLRGRSTVDGLYAVGESSCTGVHGANRLASNSLLDGLVFAYRIADDLSARITAGELPLAEPTPHRGTESLLPASARRVVQQTATGAVGVIRTAAGLAGAARTLAALAAEAQTGSPEAPTPGIEEWQTTNLHQVATS